MGLKFQFDSDSETGNKLWFRDWYPVLPSPNFDSEYISYRRLEPRVSGFLFRGERTGNLFMVFLPCQSISAPPQQPPIKIKLIGKSHLISYFFWQVQMPEFCQMPLVLLLDWFFSRFFKRKSSITINPSDPTAFLWNQSLRCQYKNELRIIMKLVISNRVILVWLKMSMLSNKENKI